MFGLLDLTTDSSRPGTGYAAGAGPGYVWLIGATRGVVRCVFRSGLCGLVVFRRHVRFEIDYAFQAELGEKVPVEESVVLLQHGLRPHRRFNNTALLGDCGETTGHLADLTGDTADVFLTFRTSVERFSGPIRGGRGG